MAMRLFGAILLVGGLAVSARAGTVKERGDRALSAYQWTGFDSLPGYTDNAPPINAPEKEPGIYEFKHKSVPAAFAYSLIIPGAGQFYTGSKLKALIFLGVEALGWTAYLHYSAEGDQQTADYKAFADAHWHDQPYWDSLKVFRDVDKWHDQEEFAHHLPYTVDENGDTTANHNHEYYENIGKYDQFVWGWDDLQQIESPINSISPELSFASLRRMDYVVMREEANASYDHARAAGIVLIGNHVVSAIEAAISAKRFNGRAQHASAVDVKVNLVNIKDTPTPWVRVAYRF